jgi:mannose-6-phosphate isomerase-like protein (cupin superfamily)
MKVLHPLSLALQLKESWSPGIIARVNNHLVKLAKLEGIFVWHNHPNEDELFYILKGSLKIQFRDKEVLLNEGEMVVIPKGVDHLPIAENPVWVMLFEPEETLNTGNTESNLTKNNLPWLV